MTFCLYKCLRAAGLHQHYARFTSAGVHRAAQLSELTMEDCLHLGICSMEDRARLIDLVQMSKVFDLDILKSDDDENYNGNVAAAQDVGSYSVVNQEFNYDGSGNPDDHVNDDSAEALAPLPCIRRRLDFNTDSTVCHEKRPSYQSSTQHIQARAPAMPLRRHQGNPVVCDGKENKLKPGKHTFPSAHQLEKNFNAGIASLISVRNTDNVVLSECASFQNPKASSAPVSLKKCKNKTFGPQNGKGISTKQSHYTDMKSTGSFGCVAKPIPVFKAKTAASYNYGLPLNTPATSKKCTAGKNRITVCVRKRPLTSAENKRKETDVVTTPSGECVIVHESKDAVDLSQYILEHRFYFNHVFGEGSSTEDVYQTAVYPLVQHMLNGDNATCFAYGQTGAGKTHTMLGSHPERSGLYALAVRDIFKNLSAARTRPSLMVFVSFFEIYCSQLYDLLNHRKRLFARENGQKVVHICELRHVRVDSVNSLLEVISRGMETRTQGTSGVNPHSSRSHALLQIQLRNSSQQIAGSMWFVDLAGSERASDTKEPDKQNRMEGAEINRSLLALKECIRALDREHSHTPFRQSKLTQVLKSAFVGDSMTCMIANISPGHGATEHTLNTLRYADRVKELKGQGVLQEKSSSKKSPLPKDNLPNHNSSRKSVGPQGKSLAEKPHLGRQKTHCGSNPSSTRLLQRDPIFISTPKKSRCGKAANVNDSKEIGLEPITPIQMLQDVGKKNNNSFGSAEKKSTRKENWTSGSQSISDQHFREGQILGQQLDKQLDLWPQQRKKTAYQDQHFTKRQSEADHSKKVSQQFTVKEASGEDRKGIKPRRQVNSDRDTNFKAKKAPDISYQDVHVSEVERKMHLRRYHQELQKFIPSANLFFHPESPSTLPSVSSSVSTPFLHQASSVCTNGSSGMDEYLDTYIARGGIIEAQSGQLSEVLTQNENSDVEYSHHEVDANDDAVEDRWVFQKPHSKARYGQVRGESLGRLIGAEGDRRVRERSTPTKFQQRKLARGATQEKDQVKMMTVLKNVKAQVSVSYDPEDRKEVGAERHNALDFSGDEMGTTEKERPACGDSAASCMDLPSENSELPSQQVPAERRLSPPHGQTNTFTNSGKLTDIRPEFNHAECNANAVFLPVQTSPVKAQSYRCSEKKPCFATNSKTLIKLSKAPTHTKEPETTVLPQNNADCFSCIMDPAGIVLLQGDRQPDTTSYLRGDSNGSLSSFENGSGKNRIEEGGKDESTCNEQQIAQYKDEEFPMSFLELPQIKPYIPNTSDSSKATQTDPSKMGRLDETEPLKVSQGYLQDQEDSQKPQMASTLGSKDPISPCRHFPCTSTHTPIIQHALQHAVGTSILSSQLISNAREASTESPYNDFKKAVSFTPQLENISSHLNNVPRQCHAITSDHGRLSNTLFQPNKTAAPLDKGDSSSQDPFTLDNLNHARWGVVEAHREQLKEMDALCQKEGMLHKQPDMAFGDYIRKLQEILKKKSQCVHSMQAQLQLYQNRIHQNHLLQQQQ